MRHELATVTDAHGIASIATTRGLEPGTILDGRYVVLRSLGAGGMGEVYAAHDRLLGDPVAIKILRPEIADRIEAQARFAEEIRLARRVTHRNVCRVFDVGVERGRVFYSMELHSGQTLQSRLDREGRMSIATAKPILGQLLAGVAAAHAAHVVHADLKPSNILLEPDDRIVVTDFGLAQQCCAVPACSCEMPHLLGTPAYMAPEQVKGSDVSEATDVFSFGVIVFELLTGVLPWRGATPIELSLARLNVRAPAMRSLRPDLDPCWDDLILRCLHVDPDARPQDAATVAHALDLAC